MDVSLTYENVFGILDAARKYMVDDLDLYCRQWIAASARCPEGALGLYGGASAAHWPDWAMALFGRVESFGAAALVSPALQLLTFEAFTFLLGSQNMFVPSEGHFFEASRRWANSAAARGEDPAAAWQRVVEAEVVRFHLMEPKQFAQEVVIPGLLSEEKALSVFVTVSIGNGSPREMGLIGKLRGVLSGVLAENAAVQIERLVELCFEQGYARALAHCLVETALADHQHCSEWVSMWHELWGALRGAGLRDECVRATVDYCQNLFEDGPAPDSLVGVWTCPTDTLGLVRILCRLNHLRNMAVLPLIRVLEVLVAKAEDGQRASCAPAESARELVAHLDVVAARYGQQGALSFLPKLRGRLAEAVIGVSSP